MAARSLASSGATIKKCRRSRAFCSGLRRSRGIKSRSSISAGMSRAVIGLRVGRDRDPKAAQPGGVVALEEQLDNQIRRIVQGCGELKNGRMRRPWPPPSDQPVCGSPSIAAATAAGVRAGGGRLA